LDRRQIERAAFLGEQSRVDLLRAADQVTGH
jgi:hypothetical protein